MLIEKLLKRYLIKLQGFPFYKEIVRIGRRGIVIKEADTIDMQKVHSWFNPGRENQAAYSDNVTNFVAKKGEKVVGFVQLVRYPDDNNYAGYWLFSLSVKTYYRRMGIGEELTRVVIKKAKEESAQELLLLVRDTNNSAVRLYYNLGFKIKTILSLEKVLAQEKLKFGYRRVAMSKLLE